MLTQYRLYSGNKLVQIRQCLREMSEIKNIYELLKRQSHEVRLFVFYRSKEKSFLKKRKVFRDRHTPFRCVSISKELFTIHILTQGSLIIKNRSGSLLIIINICVNLWTSLPTKLEYDITFTDGRDEAMNLN